MAGEGGQHAVHKLCQSCVRGQYTFAGTNDYGLQLHRYASPQESEVCLTLHRETLGREGSLKNLHRETVAPGLLLRAGYVAHALALTQKAGPPTLTVSPGASSFNNMITVMYLACVALTATMS